LIDRLNAGHHSKVILVSAPAGFGKTTLVSDWLASQSRPAAWLSLDASDSAPTRFLTYVVGALRTIADDFASAVLAMLQSPQPLPTEAVMTALINEIAAILPAFILVLDDYQAVDAASVDQALTFLIQNLPPQMQLVITTREDPDIALARLRARGQLTEVRVADLRFTPDEAALFFNQSNDLKLSPQDIAALESRTEGWITGLKLAAISMRGRDDTGSFVRSFTGSHRFVLDYLVEEVLQQQPDAVQTFLLHTSILERLCAPLCDALLDDDSGTGEARLAALERANLFLIPLDNERRWYRYHHLFAELLQQRLAQSDGTGVAALHVRASTWYEQNGLALEAFQHAAAANDIDRAARLIEGDGMPLYFRGASPFILRWLEALPTGELDARPALWVTYALAQTMGGQMVASVEDKLRLAEAVLTGAEPHSRTRDLLGQVAATRAMLAIPKNDIQAVMTQSRRALDYLHPDNLPVRTVVAWTLGYGYQVQENRAAARAAYTDALTASQTSGNLMATFAAMTCLGHLQALENQLQAAADTYQRTIELAGDALLPYTCEAQLGLARIFYEWNDLATAEHYGTLSLKLARQIENVDTPADCELLLARLELARGHVDAALVRLESAEQFARSGQFMQWLAPIAGMRVQALLRKGDVAGAMAVADAYEHPHSRARVQLAQGDPNAALAVLDAARTQAETAGLVDERLKVLALQTIAYEAAGQAGAAIATLAEALALGSGFVRIFVDEGPLMARVVAAAAARGIMPAATRALVGAFEASGLNAGSATGPAQPLVDALSERELEVLRLVAEGYSNREISERLFLALSTVKGHNRVIFDKLHVQRRTEAVARARALGLLS
jgi:LuxR family maltose regulon positive regulatory protein